MDDYGNLYQIGAWEYCEEWGHSISTFGWLDGMAIDVCLIMGVHFSKIDI